MSRKLRVVVTGGSGNIGSKVIQQLVERGHEVVNIDQRQARKPVPGVRFVYADLRERHQFQPAFEGMDAVCHLGEIPQALTSMSPSDLFATNTRIGSSVLQTAADLGIGRVVYTSTCQVYGHWGDNFDRLTLTRFPMDETEPLRPQNQYALSKVANESYAQFVSVETKLAVSIFRFPAVMQFEHLEPRWVRWMERDRGPAEGFSTYLHVKDAARAYVMAVESQTLPAGCEAYHFTASDVMSRMPIRERFALYNPGVPPLPQDWPDFKSIVSCEKARRHLGWEPTYSIQQEFFNKVGEKPTPVASEIA